MTGFKVYQHLESKDNPKIRANFKFEKEKIMKTIIAGSRGIKDMKMVIDAIEKSGIRISTVLSGRAKGVDMLGELWAMKNNVPVESYLPNWKRFGKGAGLKRNIEMINNADALIAIWDGKSKGTAHTIKKAKEKGLLVFIEITK